MPNRWEKRRTQEALEAARSELTSTEQRILRIRERIAFLEEAIKRGCIYTEAPLLTASELAIAAMLASGLSNKEVANRRNISTKTVETHRASIMRKLGLHSVVGLVLYCVQQGLVEPRAQVLQESAA